jgi:hypothetical protein
LEEWVTKKKSEQVNYRRYHFLAWGTKHFSTFPASSNSPVRGRSSWSHIRLLTHWDIVEGSNWPQLLVKTLAAAENSRSTEHELPDAPR